jgi:micrococcal nuclease
VAELLTREAEARAKRLGLWSSATYAVLDASDPERLGRLTRSFQLVEGTVAAVGESRARLYLNFAQDWRSDFTVSVACKDEKEFAASKLDLKSLAGKRIRVRGWIEWAERADDRGNPCGADRSSA